MRDDGGRKLDHRSWSSCPSVRSAKSNTTPILRTSPRGWDDPSRGVWLAGQVSRGGREALKARPVPGRPSKLSGPQLQRVYTLVVGNDPRQLQFALACGPARWSASSSAGSSA